MTNDIVLQKLETARTALAEAKTIQETKNILDVAIAAEVYAKRQQLGEEAVQYATSIKVEALAQLGRMLKETPRNTGAAGRSVEGETRSSKKLPRVGEPMTLEEMGLDKKTSKLAQDIAALPEEKLEAVKSGLIALSNVNKNVHVSNNSGENEWYTPAEYINAARKVMGTIDIDPASSEMANKTVKARKFYTAQDDGLTKEWHGKLWMNPPYSGELIKKFVAKYSEHIGQDVDEGIVLVNNATETAWFQQLVSVSSAIVFPNSRIKFIDKFGNPSGAPLQGQAFIYSGKQVKLFLEVFSEFGWGATL